MCRARAMAPASWPTARADSGARPHHRPVAMAASITIGTKTLLTRSPSAECCAAVLGSLDDGDDLRQGGSFAGGNNPAEEPAMEIGCAAEDSWILCLC